MKFENPFDQGYYKTEQLKEMGFQRVGDNVQIATNCTIIGLENISLGNNVRIDSGVTIACKSGYLKLGSYIHVGTNCYLACAGGVELSDFSGLSQGVRIYSSSDDYTGKSLTNPTVPADFLNLTIKPVLIGRHVIVGSGSTVLPGVVIGDGVAIGALSLVTRSLDEWGVYFGSPAKKINKRSKHLLEQEKLFISTLR